MKNGTLPARKLDKEKSSHHGLSDTQNPQNCFLLALHYIGIDWYVTRKPTRLSPTPAPTPPRAPRIPRALRSIVAVRGSSPQRRTVRSLTSAKDSHRAGADLR